MNNVVWNSMRTLFAMGRLSHCSRGVLAIATASLAIGLAVMPRPSLAEEAATDAPKHRKLTAVPFTAVKLDDGFWSARIATNREKSLPHNFKWCEQTGRISNFAKAAGKMPGKFEGIFFNDSDVFKVMEGASYSLADQPNEALAKQLEDVVSKVAASQQPDGYVNTYFTLVEPKNRWADLASKHELYCAGHMIEGAVAHYQATGKKTFLDVATKYADLIDKTFGPNGKQVGVCGHEEVELALVKLYQATGEERYLALAKHFIDMRGNSGKRTTFGPYCQDHVPVRQQKEIVGHAVRAMYLYTGAADVAAYTGDQGLIDAMQSLWQDVVQRKMYVTGGIGARHEGEAFGDAYELPNESAYCETCAAIGLVFWAHRLNLLHGDAQYADIVELALYNSVLAGIGQDGEHFFYVNPLASNGGHHRQPFFDCACCPSNAVRLVPSVPGYVYAQQGSTILVNLYVAGKGVVALPGNKVALTQTTRYPWDGAVKIAVEPEKAGEFALGLRIPGWAEGSAKIAVNGQAIEKPTIEKGYARLQREWKSGDQVEVTLPMTIRRVEAHPSVKADVGRVAVQRGPLVYCFEAVDNGGHARNIVLPNDPKFDAQWQADLLGGITTIRGVGRNGKPIVAVPYHVWDHRAAGEMAVWVRQDGKAKTPAVDASWSGKLYRTLDPAALGPSEPPTKADLIVPSASHCNVADSTAALCDEIVPANSGDVKTPRFTWWDHRGSKEWVQYDLEEPQKVSAVEVYWFDDAKANGQCRPPKSWRVVYRAGNEWKPVANASSYGTEIDKFNRTKFDPVETTALRLEVELAPGVSGGILEWKVE
jgi:DUF1680 family protein